MENIVGALDQAQRLARKQIGVAGPSSNQKDLRFAKRGHRHLTCRARSGVANLPPGQLMQQFFSRVAARMRFKNFAPEMAQAGKPWAEIARKLLVNFPAQMLSDSRAFAGRGDADLQVTAAHHRTEEKVAVGRSEEHTSELQSL